MHPKADTHSSGPKKPIGYSAGSKITANTMNKPRSMIVRLSRRLWTSDGDKNSAHIPSATRDYDHFRSCTLNVVDGQTWVTTLDSGHGHTEMVGSFLKRPLCVYSEPLFSC